MNGEPLGPDHGAPFRMIVPHWYAVASVKWLKRIDVITEPYAGEFQTGHYIYQWADRAHEPVRHMRVRARITDPAPGAVLDGEIVAFDANGRSGEPVRVDIGLTGEGDWLPAQLEAPWATSGRTGPSNGTPSTEDTLFEQGHGAAGNVQPTYRHEPPRVREQRHRGPVRRRALNAGRGSATSSA
jgi:DMSO/TMAO reductase YedYZ molybdopterin-dependent catalytic subunit